MFVVECTYPCSTSNRLRSWRQQSLFMLMTQHKTDHEAIFVSIMIEKQFSHFMLNAMRVIIIECSSIMFRTKQRPYGNCDTNHLFMIPLVQLILGVRLHISDVSMVHGNNPNINVNKTQLLKILIIAHILLNDLLAISFVL